jgi:hypothetical protein
MTGKRIDFGAERDKRDAHEYRLAIAQTLIDLFTKARGREPASVKELEQFVADEERAGRMPEKPIRPTREAYEKVLKRKAEKRAAAKSGRGR